MKKPYIIINKRVGLTPLAELDALRSERAELAGVPLTYAGRLDPMASGKLLVLVGDECKKRSRYDGLDKEYEFDVVLGVSTDTGDSLGMLRTPTDIPLLSEDDVRHACVRLVGTHSVPYPPFSSKVVGGKALFQHALEGTLSTISVPHTDMQVYALTVTRITQVPLSYVVTRALANVARLHLESNTGTVAPDFRKEAIIHEWLQVSDSAMTVTVVSCRAVVGSGTYIRTLAGMLGEHLGVPAFALSIHRSIIGRYRVLPVVGGWWLQKYG